MLGGSGGRAWHGPRGRRGFSLIELLVVVFIIALLIGILLPALGAARGAARKVVCAGRLRQIASAHAVYFTDNDGWIAGSPDTSGSDANEGRFNGVSVQATDWMGPLAESMGVSAPGDVSGLLRGSHDELRAERFDWYRDPGGPFQCPSNAAESAPWSGADSATRAAFTTGPMIPYAMTTLQTFTGPALRSNPVPEFGVYYKNGYRPRATKVGATSSRALVFESHRYGFHDGNALDYDARLRPISTSGSGIMTGGAFQGSGPYWNENKELDRSLAPGEPLAAYKHLGFRADMRILAFRHSPSGRRASAARLSGDRVEAIRSPDLTFGNVAFYDASVRLLDDVEATDPDLWFPSGTRIVRTHDFWRAAMERFASKLGSISPQNPYRVR